jgi:leucyl/phenylalanyl-tRNA--protein transferase
MRNAYLRLHRLGQAHSIESWRAGKLAGGLYGVRLGGVFFGESMFSRERDASKVALAHLVAVCLRNSIAVIDCQLPSAHLASLGSRTIPRLQFQALLREHISLAALPLHAAG